MKKKSLIVFITTCGGSIALLPSCSGFTYRTPNSLYVEDVNLVKGIESSFAPTIVTEDDDPSLNAYELEFTPMKDMTGINYSFLRSTDEKGEHMYTVQIDKAGYYPFTAKLKNFPNSTISKDFRINVYDFSYDLTVISADVNMGSAYGSAVGYKGEKYQVVAQPKAGYVFTGWYYGGENPETTECISKDPTFTFTMPDYNVVLKATFAIGTYHVIFKSDDPSTGIIESYGGHYEQDINFGKPITLNAIPASGYKFVGWKLDDREVYEATSTSYSFTVPASDITVTAVFAKKQYAITAQSQNISQGSISIEGETESTVYKYPGDKLTLHATAKEGYEFKYFASLDGMVIENNPATIVVGNKDTTFLAIFDREKAGVDFEFEGVDDGDTVEFPHYEKYYKNGVYVGTAGYPLKVTYNNYKYRFLGWYKDSEEEPFMLEEDAVCLNPIYSDTTITAKFEKKIYHVQGFVEHVQEGSITIKKGEQIISSTDDLHYGDTLKIIFTPNDPGITDFKGFDCGDGELGYFKKDECEKEGDTYVKTFDFKPEYSGNTVLTYAIRARTTTNPMLRVISNVESEHGTARIKVNDEYFTEYKCESGQEYKIEAQAQQGYRFVGWYYGETQVSENASTDYTMLYSSITLTAKFEKEVYKVTATTGSSNIMSVQAYDQDKNPLEGNTFSGVQGTVFYFKPNMLNSNYHFTIWDCKDSGVIEDVGEGFYKFTMPYKNVYLIAMFNQNYHECKASVSELENFNYGKDDDLTVFSDYATNDEGVLQKGIANPNSTINFSAGDKSNSGGIFVGWYNGDTPDAQLVSKEFYYNFKMPNEPVHLYARYAKSCTVSLEVKQQFLGSPIGRVDNQKQEVGFGSEITIKAYSNGAAPVTFDAWYDENGGKHFEGQSEVTFKVEGDLYLEPRWNISKYTITLENATPDVISNDQIVFEGAGTHEHGSNLTINVTNYNSLVDFKGWYSDKECLKLITSINTFTIYYLSDNVTYYAKFEPKKEWYEAHGSTPVISGDGKTLTYGLYPQTIVPNPSDELKEAAEGKANEEYFLYGGEYYVKDTGDPYLNNYTFSDGTKVEKHTSTNPHIYYFKCEPIKWNIVSTSDGTYTIDCSSILYAHRFDDDSNVYANSELRTWLNGDFYNKAFFLNNSLIQATNFSEIGADSDKVWVGSKDQYDGTWYTSDAARQKKLSDFALCNQANMSAEYGYYWTRSPDGSYTKDVSRDGHISYMGVVYPYIGVSPCLTIKI